MAKVEKATKKQIDKSRILTKILAGVLAVLMVVSVAGTLIYYVVAK